ncbi:MAG TPA: type II toxin-antitoxin system prevent-host-death family antitoxin [Rhabdochlamydiaceae bacterium]|nr:type II toxin-antitoxin system prevent-host-death family antitoxin [Rhabdochlamydiaceae bacterium]
MEEKMKAGKFKAECLKVIDRVKKTRQKVIITKRNIPVAKLVSIEEKEEIAFGKLKGTIHFIGDVVGPIDEEWDADS